MCGPFFFSSFNTEYSVVDLPDVDQEALVELALENRADLKALKKIVEVHEIESKAAQNHLLPQLDLTVAADHVGVVFSKPLENRVSVFVVQTGSTVRERTVQFGRSQGDWVVVRKGLAVGDQVVVKGHEQLYDRSRIQVLRTVDQVPARIHARGLEAGR